jgi:hypothetical protein
MTQTAQLSPSPRTGADMVQRPQQQATEPDRGVRDVHVEPLPAAYFFFATQVT